MDYTHQEILRQPTTWGKTLNYLQEKESYFSQFLAETHDNVVFTGCGSSYTSLVASHLASRKTRWFPAKGVFQFRNLFPEGVFLPQTSISSLVFLCLGETTETVKALQHFKDKFRGKTVGISYEDNSSL